MKLLKLTLTNYRQFKSTVINFSPGLIGLIGPNATGKSHLLEAIQFSLTGDIPWSTKSDLLHWGAETGFTELDFESDGVVYSVHRDLTTSTATLSSDKSSSRPVHGVTKVNNTLSSLLGIDKDIFRQAVFARQAEIDDILFTEPRIRALTLQKLCGIGEAAKIHSSLKKVVAMNEVVYDFEDELETAKAARDTTSAECEDLRTRIQGIEKSTENAAKLTEEIETNSLQVTLLKRKDEIVAQLAASKKQLEIVDNELLQNLAILKELPDIDIDEQISEYIELKSKAVIKELNTRVKEDAIAKLAELEPTDVLKVAAEELAATAEVHRTAVAELESRIKPLVSLSQALTDSNKGATSCPLCHSSISNVAELLQSTTEDLNNLRQRAVVATKQLADANAAKLAMELKVVENTRLLKEYTNNKNSAEHALVGLPDGLQPESYYDSAIVEYRDIQKNLQQLHQAIAVKTENKKNIEININNITKESDEIISKIYLSIPIEEVEKSIVSLRERLAAHTEQTTKKANLNGQLLRAEKIITNLAETIKTIRQKQDNIQKHIKALTTLHNVIDWFHYTKGPSQVASKYLQILVQDINKFLETFSVPFIVVPDFETLGFRVSFTDGRDMPEELPKASELSGGEKIILAVAFRLANYQLFADKLGLLSLDEPTVYLDADNISNFCIVVEKLKTVVKNLNLQIIVATHEASVMPYFDSVISLNNK